MKLIYILIFLIPSFLMGQSASILGAWQLRGAGDPGEVATLLITPSYLSIAVYNEQDHNFLRSYGGAYRIQNDQLLLHLEFDSKDTSLIGSDLPFNTKVTATSLALTKEARVIWARLSNATDFLAGCWRISSKIGKDGTMTKMPEGSRKTLKLIAGNRFQWIAINPVTKQFSGTGGGTYTLIDGKYTEKIDFFSRDKTRVGSALAFEAKVNGNQWEHQGKSSTGNPVHEIWIKQ